MSDMAREDLIALLEKQLAVEKASQAAAGFDEGRRLHDLHNSPYKSGTYASLTFPPYTFKPFPRMLYGPGYGQAQQDLARVKVTHYADPGLALATLARAEKAVVDATKIVASESECAEALSGWWRESPEAAERAKEEHATLVARQAAERAYEDRHLGEKARAELAAVDAAHEGHLVEVPEAPRKRGRPSNAELAAREA
jgi:hypothetical protein